MPLTQSSFSSFLVKRDHALRKRAFHQFYDEFQDHQFTLASSLAYSVKADVFRARARNYPSALEASLFPRRCPGRGLRWTDRSGSRESRSRSFATTNCAGACLGSTSCITTTPMCRWSPKSKRGSRFDEAIENVLAALQPLGRGICRVR